MKLKRTYMGFLYALTSAVICGLIPVLIQKVLTQDSIPRATALFIKFVVSAVIVLPFAAPKFKKVKYPQGFSWKLIVCALAGYFVLDEVISLRSGLGIVVILVATILVALSKREKK